MRTVFKASCLMVLASLCLHGTTQAQSVCYNYARGVNLSQYRTYKWIEIGGAGAADEQLDRDVRQAIEEQLARKGFLRVDQGAELLIAYQMSDRREKEIRMNEAASIGGYGPGWEYEASYGYAHGFSFICSSAMSTTTSSTIQIGALVLDVYDGIYGDLVWRGEVTKALSVGDDAGRRKQDLFKAVAKLLKAFPWRSMAMAHGALHS
jgi:hypothetical protein